MDEMDEIVQEFLVESAENLDQLDRDLLALENDPSSRDVLSSAFRTIHTIKGTSGFLAYERLEKLTHTGESLLSRLRDGQQTMTTPIADALLQMVDTVRALLTSIEQNGAEGDVEVEPVMAEIRALMSDAPVEAEDPAPAEAARVEAAEEAELAELAELAEPAEPAEVAPLDARPKPEPRAHAVPIRNNRPSGPRRWPRPRPRPTPAPS